MEIDTDRQLAWLKFKESAGDNWDEENEELVYCVFMDGYNAGQESYAARAKGEK